MKKTIALTLALTLLLLSIWMLPSCGAKHPIVKFAEKMEKADSYQIAVTMSDIPLLGTMTVTTMVDGNIEYTPAVLFDSEKYVETVGDVQYTYTKNDDGKWKKTEETVEEDSSSVTSDESMAEFFNPDNYEKVKDEENTYKQKKDVVFDNFSDVVMTIGENTCIIEMTATSDGMTFKTKIVISKIGEVDLTLPQVD